MTRTCQQCGKELVRCATKLSTERNYESPSHFALRKFCSRTCSFAFESATRRTDPERETIAGARWIPLGHGRHALVDAGDFDRVSVHTWSDVRASDTLFYAIRKVDYRTIWLHRFIMDAPDDVEVDHRNRDGLDCRRENLRFATHAQNMRNRKLSSLNKSGFRGVSWAKLKQRWLARIVVDGRVLHIGHYRDSHEAALMYDKAAREHFGEFAALNHPDES